MAKLSQICGKRAQAETNNPVTKNEKANAVAKTLREIRKNHKGPIFDDNLKKEVDDAIAENYHLFNPLQLYACQTKRAMITL